MRRQLRLLWVAAMALAAFGSARAQYKDAAWVKGGHDTPIAGVAFSPDSKYLATMADVGSIKIWDVATGNLLRTIVNNEANAFAFSPTGDTLATGNRVGTVSLWRVSTATLLTTFNAHSGKVNGIAYASDGRHILTAGDDQVGKYWNLANTATAERTFTGHTGVVNSIAISADGQLAATTSDDFSIKTWDLTTAGNNRTITDDKAVVTVVISGDHKYVVASGGGCPGNAPGCGVRIIDPASGAVVKSYGPHYNATQSVAISADGMYIASGAEDGTVWVYRTLGDSTPTYPRQVASHRITALQGSVFGVAFSKDGKYLASVGRDKNIRLWNVGTSTQARVFSDSSAPVKAVAFNNARTQLASGDDNGKIKIWDVASGNVITPKPMARHRGPIRSIVFHPTEATTMASSSDDGTIRIWNPTTGDSLRLLQPSGTATKPPITSIAMTGDGQIVSGQGGNEGSVKVWNVQNGTVTRTLSGHTGDVLAVAVSPNGQYVVSGGDDMQTIIWNLATGANMRTIVDDHTGAVTAIAINPDGRFFVTASADRTIVLRALPSGDSIGIFRGHTGAITDVAFSSDGAYIVSSSEDKTVKVWKLSSLELLYTYDEIPFAHLSVAMSNDNVASGTASSSIVMWKKNVGNGGTPLVSPQPLLPEQDAQNQKRTTSISWGPVPNAQQYHLQVSKDEAFTGTMILNDSAIADTTKKLFNLSYKTKYYWRVRAKSFLETSAWSPVRNFTIEASASVEEEILRSSGVVLDPVAPNPSRGAAIVGYSLERALDVRISVLDLHGRVVATLVDGRVESGHHEARIDASSLPSGSYFIRIEAGGGSFARPLEITR